MEPAAFQLADYQFVKVILDFNEYVNESLDVVFAIDGKFEFDKANSESNYLIEFEVSVHSGDNKNNFLSVHCIAKYTLTNVTCIEEIPDFFYQNAIAILFPYIRAYISLITNQANMKPVILPTLNLTKLAGPLKESTMKL